MNEMLLLDLLNQPTIEVNRIRIGHVMTYSTCPMSVVPVILAALQSLYSSRTADAFYSLQILNIHLVSHFIVHYHVQTFQAFKTCPMLPIIFCCHHW
jgi:hypothetical protein